MKKREERKVSGRALRNLSSRLYHADRRRNLTAVAAVAMSAMLVIVALSTILTVSELMKWQQQMLLGTQAEGMYLYVNGYQYDCLRNSGYFDDVRLVIGAGKWETETSNGEANKIYYAEEETADWNFNGLEEGSWPLGMDEIAVDRNFVEVNGGEIRVGSRVQITLRRGGAAETKKEAVVTGICTANDVLGENRIYVSEKYMRASKGDGYMNVYCRFEPGKYTDEELEGILLGAAEMVARADINTIANPNAGNRMDIGTIALVAGLSALAAVCAGLMVYTIYYISAVKNTARYGQLKLLGVTEGQVKKIVLRHAMRQYLTGLPVGCILGVVFAYIIMPFAASFAGLKDAAPALRSQYFLCAAAVSLVVVLFGAKKPMRMLASVPPVHAAVLADGHKRRKKAAKSVRFTAGSFARKNIRRRAKKTTLVATSAMFVMVIFVCTMNAVNSLDVDALMLNVNQFADIEIATEHILNLVVDAKSNVGSNIEADYLPDGLENRLEEVSSGMDMVYHYNISMCTFLYGEEAEKFCSIVLGDGYRKDAEEEDFGVQRALEYQKSGDSIMAVYDYRFYEYGQVEEFEVYEGSIDREKFESGKYVLAVAQDSEGESLYHVGDKVSLYSEYPEDADELEHYKPDENGHYNYFDSLPRKDYEVLAVIGDSYRRQMSSGDAHMNAALGFIFPMQAMDEMPKKPGLFMVAMDAPDVNMLERIEPLVAELLEKEGGEDVVSSRSRSVYKKQLEQFGMTLALIGNGLVVLLGVMFVVSFLNSIVSGIAERKEEFATLQAVGMTRHRLIAVLRWENLYTVMAAVVPGYITGQLVSFAAINALSSRMNYLVWKPDLLSGILLAAAMCVLAMAYPNRRTDVGTAGMTVHL